MPRLHIALGLSLYWAATFILFNLCVVKIVTPCPTGFGLLAIPWWDSVTESKLQNHEKSLVLKYGRMQRKIPSQLVCGFRGTCLD